MHPDSDYECGFEAGHGQATDQLERAMDKEIDRIESIHNKEIARLQEENERLQKSWATECPECRAVLHISKMILKLDSKDVECGTCGVGTMWKSIVSGLFYRNKGAAGDCVQAPCPDCAAKDEESTA